MGSIPVRVIKNSSSQDEEFFCFRKRNRTGRRTAALGKVPVGLCLARGRFPFGSYLLKGFPLWGKLSPQVTDEGELCGHCNNTGWFVAAARTFPPHPALARHLPPKGKALPPAVKWLRKNYGSSVGAAYMPPVAAIPAMQPNGKTARASNARPYNRIGKLRQSHDSTAG